MLAGRPGLSTVMVARAAPLGRLASLLDARAVDGRPTIALVSGEAGVGKTRLLQELTRSAPDGTVVLAGGAEPGSLGRPLELAASLLPGWRPALGPDALLSALDELLRRTEGTPAIVVFEDLHWADAESVLLFERFAMADRPAALLIGTFRHDELRRRQPAGEMFERLERRHAVQRVNLTRLDRVGVGAFLAAIYGRPVGSAVIDALLTRTGGNPFFLEEFVTAAGGIAPEQLIELPLPWSLTELVSRQLEGLSADERRVTEAVAVLGRRVDFDVLSAVTGNDEASLISHLRALVSRGLLVEDEEDEFGFRHDLVREAVAGQLLGRERRRLHEQALAAFRAMGCGDPAEMALHAAGAGRYDEMVELARAGVAHYQTCGSSFQVLRLAVEALAEAPDDHYLLEAAGRAAWLLGYSDEAITHAERWYRLAVEQPERAHAAYVLGRAYRDALQGDDSDRIRDDVEAMIDDLPEGEERALAFAFIAQIHMLDRHPEETVAWADKALAEVGLSSDSRARAQALVEKGSCRSNGMGKIDGQADLEAGVALAERLGEWVLVARGLNNLLDSVGMADPRWDTLAERMRQAAVAGGFDSMSLLSHRGWMVSRAIYLGDRAEADQRTSEFVTLADGANPKHRRWTNWAELHLQYEAGVLASETRLVESDVTERRLLALAYQLTDAAIRNDRDGVDELVEQLIELLRDPSAHEEDCCVLALEAAIRAGATPEGVHRLAERIDHEIGGGLGRAARGLAAQRAGDHEAAVAALDGAIGQMQNFYACHRASVLIALARSQAALGHRSDALVALNTALRLLDHWPGWRRDEATALAERLGGGSDDRQLTAREHEVAALLAAGLTNAELARRLYISPKTAAVHVSNILAKLGMTNRAEVAAWVVRTGQAETAPADGVSD
jgi:DNA-binding CsgD family transcriptional regulator